MTNLRNALILISVICFECSQGSDFCGVLDIDPESLIADGRKPTEMDWPWIARIYINDRYYAGGSLGNFFFLLKVARK